MSVAAPLINSCNLLRASQGVRAGARPKGPARLISFLRASHRVRAGARPKGPGRMLPRLLPPC
eukprot:5647493-Pyramimonas_sp.AAC.1